MTNTFQQKESSDKAAEASFNQYPNEAIRKVLEEDQSVHALLGLTKKDMEFLYIIVKNLYDREKYKEVLPLFQLFALYDRDDKRAWMGLGACNEKLSDYANAIFSYSTVTRIDTKDPLPHFRMVHCWLAGKKTPQALQALDQSILLSAGKPKYAKLHETALHLKQALSI